MRIITFARRAAVLACAIGICAAALAVMPTVKVVPWVPSAPTIAHDTYVGKTITLKGTTDVSGSNFRWTWDFGDGSPVATGDVGDPYAVEARHAYAAPEDTYYTARLTVQDKTTLESADKPYYIYVATKTLPIEVNVAIDEGLWYLHKTQNRFTSGGVALGDWTVAKLGGYANASASSVSAVNLNAFEVLGHQEIGNADNPYTETVQRAVRRLFQRLSVWGIGLQTNPLGTFNSDQNANGIGIVVNDGYEFYQGGMIMDAIIATGTPNATTTTGPANVVGRLYRDILQDMVDAYIYSQYDGSDGGGGWRYSANQYPDNSACQWAAIGMLPAEREWGCSVPAWVKQWNTVWLNKSQYNAPGNFSHGAFGYQPGYWFPWGPYATTPSGMVQMAMNGIGRGNSGWPSWNAAETFIRDNFGNTGNATQAIKSYYYGLFSFVKAMLLHDTNGDDIAEPIAMLHSTTPGVPDLDWYAAEVANGDPTDGVARTLVNGQSFGTQWGYWDGHYYSADQRDFETAWAILMLNLTIIDPGRPVAVALAVPNPALAGQLITLDGSTSYHTNPARVIDSWDWDLDNDGTFDVSGPVITHTFPGSGVYPVRLLVTDDGSPEKPDEDVVDVWIGIPPLPPTADPDGPYVFCPQAQPWFLDGRKSSNPDEGESEPGAPGDTLQEYAWELDGDNDFNDAFGATPDVTAYFLALPPGTYPVELRVTDTTATSFPSLGFGDLSSKARTTVTVKASTDPDCDCIELAATLDGKKVQLSWTVFSLAAQYAVYRGESTGGPYIWIASVVGLTYTDDSTVSGTTYFYVVRPAALNGDELCQSNEIEITPLCDLPVVLAVPSRDCSNLARYYRKFFIESGCYGRLQYRIWIGDTGTPGWVAGPFEASSKAPNAVLGDVVRVSRGTAASVRAGNACVKSIITVKGLAEVWAEEIPTGRAGPSVLIP